MMTTKKASRSTIQSYVFTRAMGTEWPRCEPSSRISAGECIRRSVGCEKGDERTSHLSTPRRRQRGHHVWWQRGELKFLSRFWRRHSAHSRVSRAPRSMYIVAYIRAGRMRAGVFSLLETLHLENLAATMVLLRSRPELMQSVMRRGQNIFMEIYRDIKRGHYDPWVDKINGWTRRLILPTNAKHSIILISLISRKLV